MTGPLQHILLSLTINLRRAAPPSIGFALTLVLTPPAQAQTFTVLHSFTGGQDGGQPYAGLTMDKAGNLYGTTAFGGGCGLQPGCGTVFKLTRKGSGWVFTPLYTFQGGTDGAYPLARVVFGPDGTLYGTTFTGGISGCYNNLGCGTVFNLRPPPRACTTALCPWTETVLYRFTGGGDGGSPGMADLIFDQAGSLYGTTIGDNGVVYKLAPSNGGWTESVLYTFTRGNDGWDPGGGVIFDPEGNLYGVAQQGGALGDGTVYELTPSGSGWTENTLFDFQTGFGKQPVGSPVFDVYGNLFVATSLNSIGGTFIPGELNELQYSTNNWSLAYAYDFDHVSPQAGLTMDTAGNLYGDAPGDGDDQTGGFIYKLSPSNGSWTVSFLYSFRGGGDGDSPDGTVLPDANGNLYGTAQLAGAYGVGTVWEITP